MNLKDLDLVTRTKYTSHYPMMITGSAASGKTRALENMSVEDKKRTVVLNFDVKPVGEGRNDEFHSVYTIAATSEQIDKQIELLNGRGRTLVESGLDKKDPKVLYIKGMLAHLKGIKSASYFIDDIESVDKIISTILDATFDESVDRVVVDTLSSTIDFCETYSNTNFTGREIWAAYGFSLQRIMQAVKESTIFGLKYSYVFAHHDYIPAGQYKTTPKQVVAVKGGIMKGNIEQHYSTIVYTYLDEEGRRMFECDNRNSLDTSRTKLVADKFSFERESLDDLEQLHALKKECVDGKLVEIS